MEKNEIIPAEECCTYYNIEFSFIQSLDEYGLISLNKMDEKIFIHHDELPNLEKYMHLHYDLNINLEGLEAITYLLERVRNMQHHMTSLENRLSRYE
jgi:MerR HTH family regulatory protein